MHPQPKQTNKFQRPYNEGEKSRQNRTGRQHGSGSRHWLRRQLGLQSVH